MVLWRLVWDFERSFFQTYRWSKTVSLWICYFGGCFGWKFFTVLSLQHKLLAHRSPPPNRLLLRLLGHHQYHYWLCCLCHSATLHIHQQQHLLGINHGCTIILDCRWEYPCLTLVIMIISYWLWNHVHNAPLVLVIMVDYQPLKVPFIKNNSKQLINHRHLSLILAGRHGSLVPVGS